MKHLVLPVLILLCFPVYCSVLGNNQATSFDPKNPTDSYDVASFSAELNRLAGQLREKPSANEIADLRKSLPQSWSVSTPERTYSISTKPLRDLLDTPSTAKAEVWIRHLQDEVSSSQRKVAKPAAAQSELDHILANPEFAAVRPPSALQILRARLAAWLERMLLKFFRSIGRHPMGAEILFWLLLIGGVAFVALWVFRFLSSRDRMDSLKSESSIATTRTWQEWIRNAREAAKHGDFREAVHSTYWAGIARLEDIGAVPRDRTKTPREYLRLVTISHSGEASLQRDCKEPLMALTSRLERIWYANRAASSEDFRDSLRQLEALGCLLE
jgi:hypothetical protein